MSKRNTIIIAVAAIITLAGFPFVYAQHMRGMHDGMHAGMHDGAFGAFGLGHLERAKEALGLSDAQVDQLKGIMQDLRTQNAPYRQQMHGTMLQVAQLLVKDPNNVAAAQALLDQQAAAEQSMKSNALAAASKALNVLTPDQRTKVADFISKRAAMVQNQ